MGQGDHGLPCGQIDDAHGLAEGDVTAAVSLGLLDGEVVELGIAAVTALDIEGEERMARALEGNQLITEGHLATQGLIFLAVQAISILHLVVVVVTNAAEVDSRGLRFED